MNIYDQISAYKNNVNDETRLRIPIRNEEGETLGGLSCLDKGMAAIPGLAAILANWRQANMKWFMTQFTATPARTQDWIDEVVIPSPDRIMFLIFTADGDMIGHYALKQILCWYAELDNGLRGEKRGPKGMMHYAEIALLSWIFGVHGIRVANLWLFSNNEPTVKWHLSTGYEIGDSVPLFKREHHWGIEYSTEGSEGTLADFNYLEMRVSRKALIEKHPWVKDRYPWKADKLITGY